MDVEIGGLCRIDVKWTNDTLEVTSEGPKECLVLWHQLCNTIL